MLLNVCVYLDFMSKVILGEFIFDSSSNLLFSGETELEAEPKVLELLAFLLIHQDRYVSLQELHEHVWAGRVVSDTAVRGTIKKLRNLLGDTNIDEPKYIKSLSKRGYKLVCYIADTGSTAPTKTATATEAEAALDLLEASGGYADAFRQPNNVPVRLSRMFSIAILFLITAALLWFVLQRQQDTPLFAEPPLSSQLIPTIAGEKRGLAVSPDGAYLAFIGRTNQSEAWQLYLMDRQSRDIRLLPITTQQPTFIVFEENHSLLVVDLVLGNSSIYRLQLDKNMQLVSEDMVMDFPVISHFSLSREKGDWLINATDDIHSALKLYRWDGGAKQLQLLRARSSITEHIYRSAYSPSGLRLASAVLINGVEFRLEVQDLQSKQIFYSEQTTNSVNRLEWLDDESFIFLDDTQGVVLVELAKNRLRVIMEHGEEKIEDFAIAGTGQTLLLLRNQYLSEPVFYELALEPELSSERIVNVPHGLRMLHYAGTNQGYFGVIRQQDKRMLVKYAQLNSNKEVLFVTDKHIEILEHHPAQSALLLQAGQQLIVLNLDNNRVELVSTSQSFLDSHAAFSLDGARIYYGQLVAGEWELYQFDRASQRSHLLVKGYRSIRETPKGFIAATGKGDLYLLDQELRQLQSLGHSINTELISRWHVKNQRLIWSDFDFTSTWLNQLDLVSGKFQQSRFPYEKMWPRFAINQDGSYLLGNSLNSSTTNLNEISLPEPLTKK